MNWQTRTREASYTSPGGQTFDFDFTTADREFSKLSTAYNFPGVVGTYIQDLGSSDDRYPMRCIFWGDDHDAQAEAFREALAEPGRGQLTHPRDGLVKVYPFGSIKFREDLVRSANQTIVEVEFWESTIVLNPNGSAEPRDVVLRNITLSRVQASTTFSENIERDSAFDVANLRGRFSRSVEALRVLFAPVIGSNGEILRRFNQVADSIVQGVPTLAAQPEILADQVNILLSIPTTLKGAPAELFGAYNQAISTLISLGQPDNQLRETVNDFRSDELFAVSALTSLMDAAVNTTYPTRSDSVSSAANITDQFNALNVWREINYAGLE